ncbi:MAG: glycine cleavage system protein H [Halobacteriovoraceae bacterium]|nr:glycine cleavage system protein H [Halobacteriovoraceae bacterium]|tara:strand:+ start:10565 stop:10951 length:387 start_codon:yes stop_codon:yes gene_type:complete
MTKIIEGLKYTEEHEWIALDGNIATIGITDFAQSSLGDIVFVELPAEGEEIEAGNSFGVVESIKSVSDLYSPISGKVTEKNDTVEGTPENINEDAFGAWLIKLEVHDTAALDNLMDHTAYQEYCEANS